MITQLQLRRDALTESRLVELPEPELGQGEALLAIDRFALTANNVSYALSGATIGYWGYFPAPEPWGLVPVWGFADVVASRHPDLPVGERVYGFFPTASHVLLARRPWGRGALSTPRPIGRTCRPSTTTISGPPASPRP